jgi:hypothetical protein
MAGHRLRCIFGFCSDSGDLPKEEYFCKYLVESGFRGGRPWAHLQLLLGSPVLYFGLQLNI